MSTASGEARADVEIDLWMHPETGLELRRVSVVEGSSPGPTGEIPYHEEYTIVLRSLEPIR